MRGHRNNPVVALLLLGALLVLGESRKLASTACPFIPPFGNPANVLAVFFSRMAQGLKPASDDDIRVVYVNLQSFEFPVFRYVFKILQRNGSSSRVLYLGVLSTLPSFDDLNNPDAVHSVVRFVMTADLLDTQRILGDFTMSKYDELNCGNVRSDFSDYISQSPVGFDSGKGDGVDLKELGAWLNKVALDQNGGQPPQTVDFQGVLDLLKAYKAQKANSTGLPSLKVKSGQSGTAASGAQSGSRPTVMYSLPLSQILKGDGSSMIRGFTVDSQQQRSLKSVQRRSRKTPKIKRNRLKFKHQTRKERRQRTH